MKKIKLFCAITVLIISFGTCGCTISNEPRGTTYYEYFDTVSSIFSYGNESSYEFEKNCEGLRGILEEYHKLFDIYYEYSGMNNLKTVNDNAGIRPVFVDYKIIEFLMYAKEIYDATEGELNIAMGSVLKLWHDCRDEAAENPEAAKIPSREELCKAAEHTSIDSIVIDSENQTVYISDPLCRIDVGALGKGYATAKATEWLRAEGADSYVLNVGGNISTVGEKRYGGGWITGITNPDRDSKKPFALKLELSNIFCVTSGSYERYYEAFGKKYHHIIDKDTLMPSEYFTSVTVISADGAAADALSTALFCMPLDAGMALCEKMNAEAVWIDENGNIEMTEGAAMIVK